MVDVNVEVVSTEYVCSKGLEHCVVGKHDTIAVLANKVMVPDFVDPLVGVLVPTHVGLRDEAHLLEHVEGTIDGRQVDVKSMFS